MEDIDRMIEERDGWPGAFTLSVAEAAA